MQVPRVTKITLNMGVGEAAQDAKPMEEATKQLGQITGQKAQVRRARKSIANFKLRAGMPVGLRVTLRGDRMCEMLDRLISIALPRIRDFRGISPTGFDGQGNYNLGVGSRSSSRRSTTTRSTGSGAWTSPSRRPRRPTTRAGRC